MAVRASSRIEAIALTTLGLSRAVTENRTSRRRQGPITWGGENGGSARRTTLRLAPALRAVTIASATSRSAPRAEFVCPLRSRVAQMTGADSGVLTVAISAFN